MLQVVLTCDISLLLKKVREEIKNIEEILIQILDESSTRGFIM